MPISQVPTDGQSGERAPAEPPEPSGPPPDPHGPEAVGVRVRSSIAGSGLAQREFARRIGLDETKLSKSLRGTRRFSAPELVRIAEVSQVTLTWLLSGSDPVPGPAAGQTAATGTATGSPGIPGGSGEPAGPGAPRPGRDVSELRRRRKIVEAGAQLFADRGLHAVRISEIASACELSTSSVYHYFTSKRELFEEVLRHMAARALDEQAAVLDPADGPARRLRHLLELRLPTPGVRADEWSIWVQGWAEVAVGAGTSTNQAEAYQRWSATVLEVLREGQEAGVIIRGPTEDLALQLTSLLDGLGLKVLTGTISVDRMRTVLHESIDRFLIVPG